MAEATFARSFLANVSARPTKLSSDHVEDPTRYPARPPYILPRMPKAMSKPINLAPGQERSVTVTLKSLRNPPLNVKLTSQPLSTSVLDIKGSVSAQTRIPVDKMRVLHSKRPLQDSKILKDILGDADTSVELSVMVIGGAAAIPAEDGAAADGSAASTAEATLGTKEFWDDLQGFLMQRLKDQEKAEELSKLFKSTWESTSKS